MKMKFDYASEEARTNVDSFKRVLTMYFPKAGLASKRIRALDIGCGYSTEYEAVRSFFGSELEYFLGIDKDRWKVHFSRAQYGQSKHLEFKLRELPEDACEIEGRFNLVILRHHSLVHGSELADVLKAAFELTCKGGVFVGTTYTQPEYDLLRRAIQSTDYQIVVGEKNPNSKDYTPDCGIDRNVLLAMRR